MSSYRPIQQSTYEARVWRLTDRGREALGLGPTPTVETVGVPLRDNDFVLKVWALASRRVVCEVAL